VCSAKHEALQVERVEAAPMAFTHEDLQEMKEGAEGSAYTSRAT
jgi:hypothetical protein